MPSVLLFTEPDAPGKFFLGEVEVGEDEATTPLRIHGKNITTTTLRRVVISVEGENADHVQLSVDGDTWVDNDLLAVELLASQDEFVFYSRAVSPEEGSEAGTRKFEYVVRATSIG
jgi:hypothetical protein